MRDISRLAILFSLFDTRMTTRWWYLVTLKKFQENKWGVCYV